MNDEHKGFRFEMAVTGSEKRCHEYLKGNETRFFF